MNCDKCVDLGMTKLKHFTVNSMVECSLPKAQITWYP